MQTGSPSRYSQENEGQVPHFSQLYGVTPSELDNKLCHLVIDQQEKQISELESELALVQTRLHEKEVELQALRDCVRRMAEFSSSFNSGKSL